MGIVAAAIVEEIGGGRCPGGTIKAVQTGGPPAAASRPSCSTRRWITSR